MEIVHEESQARTETQLVTTAPPAQGVAMVPKYPTAWRKKALTTAALGLPIGAGVLAALSPNRHVGRSILLGGAAALALGALRWQMGRWFTDAPAYDVVARAGKLEVRTYPALVEARTVVDAHDFERALAAGFGRLACFVFGANTAHQDLAMTTPVLTEMHEGRYSMTFLMPARRTLASLPTPDDPRIELREAPARQVAALAFHGRFTAHNVGRHEHELLRQVIDAGLVGKGSVALAGYDSPATLPFLRRNELWLHVV